ncbi:hypothetical protein [Roseovarius autotrophicus]|uniref:hypothetical protein n=1 Tax=Roseovarius autotrophicus TaxID=2824121 RepID=UPI0019DE7887|nr:hypothetical protein [Roseovarius autotrophicus]MBE0452410.1 hypothetical protein [Roseovarius sp.]
MPFTKFLGAAGLMLVTGAALAAPVSVTTVLDPQEQIRFEMGDGTPHFVLAVRREGVSEGEGALAGAKVTEFGWHDIKPPMGGDPRGYLRFEAENGDVAIVKFTVRAVFMKGAEKPELHDDGFWELVNGTGQFEGKRGVGVIKIEPAGGPKRLFTLSGEIGDRP